MKTQQNIFHAIRHEEDLTVESTGKSEFIELILTDFLSNTVGVDWFNM